jgi:hypothetical protein
MTQIDETQSGGGFLVRSNGMLGVSEAFAAGERFQGGPQYEIDKLYQEIEFVLTDLLKNQLFHEIRKDESVYQYIYRNNLVVHIGLFSHTDEEYENEEWVRRAVGKTKNQHIAYRLIHTQTPLGVTPVWCIVTRAFALVDDIGGNDKPEMHASEYRHYITTINELRKLLDVLHGGNISYIDVLGHV